MEWTPEVKQFITDHLMDDTARLLLSAHRYPSLDMPFIVEQIEARRRLRTKLPEWFSNPDLIMGGRIPAEQCSSEQTARYKRSLLTGCRSLCDMTGGMGVDFWYMSRGLHHAIYTECQPHLIQAARHNFSALQSASAPTLQSASDSALPSPSAVGDDAPSSLPAIQVRQGLSTQLPIPDVDAIYLDPARRSNTGSRIYEVEDCEPNVIAWQDDLLPHCSLLITKLSPMADIHRTLQRLRRVTAVHVVSVRNECKELLFVQKGLASDTSVLSCSSAHVDDVVSSLSPLTLHCIDFLPSGPVTFQCSLSDLHAAAPVASSLSDSQYLYEPDVSLMKAQAFAPLAQRFPVQMLEANTHLFVSSQPLPHFPGRAFVIEQVLPFASRQLKQLRKAIPQANVATRNFPLTPEAFRSRTGIRDGGDHYLFGCTTYAEGPLLFLCHKLAPES